MVEAVTFDATGTLFHCPSIVSLYTEAFHRHGLNISQRQIRQLFPLAWKELDCTQVRGGDRFADHPRGATGFWEDLVARICTLAEAGEPSPFLAPELFQVFARGSSWEVFDETRAVLKDLNDAGFRLAVVSNWDHRLKGLLQDLGLGDLFETVVVSSEIGHAKPDSRIFMAALERMELNPIQVFHVGDDRINDYEGAMAAGLQAFLLDRRHGVDLSSAAQRVRGSRL